MPRSSNARLLPLIVLIVLIALLGCGGGGGGGSSSAPGGGVQQGAVTFLGIAFGTGGGVTAIPPLEDTTSFPPTIGAPLDLTVIFRFDDVPLGPFNQTTLPVFTTAAEITPEAGATATPGSILAKGAYVLVGHDVEFRPFVPTAPLQIKLSAPPAAVPGLLPGSIYTARITTSGSGAIPNLGVVAGVPEVKFGTTSNPAAYYPSGVGASDAPEVVATVPAEDAHDFFPGTYASVALGAAGPSFPPGDDSFLVTYAQPVAPLASNLDGVDLDGDGVIDPSFFLRWPATRLLVARTVPQDAFGIHAPFAALVAVDDEPGTSAAFDGSDVVLHGSSDGALPDADDGFSLAPLALANAVDPDLLFMLLPPDGGGARLAVAGHVLGDPSFASLALDADGGEPALLDTGLVDPSGLVTTLDGRLVTFDRGTRSLVELLPVVMSRPPLPDDVGLLPPLLTEVSLGDGTHGFRSAPWSTGVASSIDVRALAAAPSGTPYALGVVAGEPFPSLFALVPIDADVDDAFDADEGLPDGDAVFTFSADYGDVVFLDETTVLVLDTSLGVIDRVDLGTGLATRMVDGLPGATALTQGFLATDVSVEMVLNASSGAVLSIAPTGVLPFGEQVRLMQRNTFRTLYGVSALNTLPGLRVPVLGAERVLTVTTAEPLAGASATVDDVFVEGFSDTSNRSKAPLVTSPPADWAAVGAAGAKNSLRAAAGLVVSGNLGDFLPQQKDAFDPALAFVRADLPWVLGDKPEDREELDLDWTAAKWKTVLIDTDAQNFPLADGSTPGVTVPSTVIGGQFVFRDFIIPLGVRVIVKGSNPLRITATGSVRIDGVLDVSGGDGLGDDSFYTGYLPVPGGTGGPGGGRGGDAHPTRFDPTGPGTLNQYVTPERAERGLGPVLGAFGGVTMQAVGGWGGVSTAGYDPYEDGYPKVPPVNYDNGAVPNSEYHRPPGGGGGTFHQRGQASHTGSGSYLVQSESTWFPFDKCPIDDDIHDSLYGNEENFWSLTQPNTPLQCVYMLGTPENPDRIRPGSDPGDLVFVDDDPENDFIGVGAELPVLIGGQGGGGGGTRVNSINHRLWSIDSLGSPDPFGPPWYPVLFPGVYLSPTMIDSKGGAGGGGGGSVEINSLGDLIISRTGHIDATGGHGGGGEVVQNSNVGAGGGGGSGGAVLLRAAGRVIIEADAQHLAASYTDADGDDGASIEVSGGFGRDAMTDTPNLALDLKAFRYEYTRSDGGSGGMGLIQLQEGGDDGVPTVEQGAFLFAKQRVARKLGSWTGDLGLQVEHPDWIPNGNDPDELRYIDMLHYPRSDPENGPNQNRWFVLNGSFPPVIPRTSSSFVEGFENTWGGAEWLDTAMTDAHTDGRWAVRDPIPVRVMQTYDGWDPETFKEFDSPPGTTYAVDAEIPMVVIPKEPDGTPYFVEHDGQQVFDPEQIIDRLPVIPIERTPAPFGQTSHGVSRWLDFQGVRGRLRDGLGRTPPFFQALHGTYNPGVGAVPVGQDGRVALSGKVPGLPAKYVLNAPPFDPGLFGNGFADPPYNDVEVDAPELFVDNALTDNATVRVIFQGAYAIRPGSSVPDPDSATAWVSDLTQLDGYPLVRFAVIFDLGADPVTYPFSSQSFRPQVDTLRMRMQY